MTALVVSDVFPPKPGGSGRWFYELYRRLPREEFVVAAGDHAGWEAFDQTHDLRVVRMQIRLESWGVVGFKRGAAYWSLARRLLALCRQHGAGMIHAGSCFPEGFAAWLVKRMTGVPYLLFVHGEEMRIARGSRELTWMARRVLNGAERLIANSHNTARLLRAEWDVAEGRISVLHPGVDTERFKPAPRCLATRERLGWGERRVILTVGRLQKRKGHDMLIRALPAIRAAVPDVLYAIVGDGEERAALERLVDEMGVRGQVQFRGEPNDAELVECYQQCDLFVLPNREVDGDIEGFGMVLVEAQACGKPVIAGDSGGTGETLIAGQSGSIIDCSVLSSVERISDLLSDNLRLTSMANAARNWVTTHFHWAYLARAYSDQLVLLADKSQAQNSQLPTDRATYAR